ncbi:alanine:glyoxylate aminotransferase 3 [Actinidia rufa]|uniref:Alanine:glyoxylate aminotransferase 3 n=1 Tax=Actinidia rufa TaxID=165716 RepID=A0A7J0E7Q0_9ERIC|nr:alanine:glyoxylate aminotransferase 3 [Actinidia rufa]
MFQTLALTPGNFFLYQSTSNFGSTTLIGIGNGIPLGAVVTTLEIAQVLTHRSYFNTFGGNSVCTAAGHAVLGVIERENLQENAHDVGSYLKERLTDVKDKHESIGDVRGAKTSYKNRNSACYGPDERYGQRWILWKRFQNYTLSASPRKMQVGSYTSDIDMVIA